MAGSQQNPTFAARKYKSYSLSNYRQLSQIAALSEEQRFAVEVVGQIFPFKTNSYVVEDLIDWSNVPEDPCFNLNFPQAEMLQPRHFSTIADLLKRGASRGELLVAANKIRYELNPHPAGQLHDNVPSMDGVMLHGMQHKYKETVLFFPSQGQACHAYCTFCFRWPQFVGMNELKFEARQVELLVKYLKAHSEITDVLFTGGDPLVMNSNVLASYIDPLLEADLPNLTTIRIGTKSLAYWPYRFVSDPDTEDLLNLFRKVNAADKRLSIMAHFNHPRELQTPVARLALQRIRETGAEIHTQTPLLNHINADPALWIELWREQVRLGCLPYYMFIVRDTGAQHYFGVPLVQAWDIFREAYRAVSGLARSVRGPVMSAHPGKIHVVGVNDLNGTKLINLQFLQGRNPEWVLKPFYAEYDAQALWLSDLKPAFGAERFFFEDKQ